MIEFEHLRQPGPTFGINRGHPLTANLCFLYSPVHILRDLQFGAVGTIPATDNIRPTQRGLAYKVARQTSGGLNFGQIQPITSEAWSILAIANPGSADGVTALYSQRYGTSPYNQIELVVNGTSGLASSAGKLSMVRLCTDGTSRPFDSTASTYADGNFHTYVATCAGPGINPVMYFDGIQVAGSGGGSGSGNVFSTNLRTRIGNIGDYSADAAYCAACDILLVACWNGRVLSPGDVVSLTANPWQLFEPERIFVRAPSLVAGLAAHPMRGGGAAANPMWGYA